MAGKGRPTGSTSAFSNRMRMRISEILDKHGDKLDRWLEDIEQTEGSLVALQAFERLLEYGIPKMARIEHTGAGGGPIESELTATLNPTDAYMQFLKAGKPD